MTHMLRRLSPLAKPLLLASVLWLTALPASAVNWVQSEIEGQDSDADGIRDDVGRFINQQWKDSSLQAWAREAARAGQAYIMSNGNPYALHRAHAFMERARRCLTETHSPDAAREVINQVLGAQLDTYERRQTYQQALSHWVHRVQHESLPSQPDDNWNPGCGRQPSVVESPARSTLPVAKLPTPAPAEDGLPPPNFFLDEDEAESGTNPLVVDADGPSTSVRVMPLPAATDGTGATSQGDAAVPISNEQQTGGWTTYRPRQRARPAVQNTADTATHLPVQKLRSGQSAALPIGSQNNRRERPNRSEPVIVRGDDTTLSRAVSGDALPPGLQELAPYIRRIERR